MLSLFNRFIETIEPNFNKENSEIIKSINTSGTRYILYRDKETGKRFAKYFPDFYELQVETGIFTTLEGLLGDEMTIVIDWFNNEFEQNAEVITF